MVTEDERPIGAPVLPPRRRDRFSMWVAAHRWSVPLFRLAGGLLFVALVAVVSGADLPWANVVGLVAGAVLGGRVGEHEKERGDLLRDPPDSLPAEFSEQFVRAPATDGRYIRPGHM